MTTDRLNGGARGGGGGQRGGSSGFPGGGQHPFEEMFKYELRLFEFWPQPCLSPTQCCGSAETQLGLCFVHTLHETALSFALWLACLIPAFLAAVAAGVGKHRVSCSRFDLSSLSRLWLCSNFEYLD